MNLNAFMQQYADEIGGRYSEYDGSTSIIVVPLPDERYQTVLGKIKRNTRHNRLSIEFLSKVCQAVPDLDLRKLLEENTLLNHATFSITENFVHVRASSFVASATEDMLKEIIQEVANVADEYEFKLTGNDLH